MRVAIAREKSRGNTAGATTKIVEKVVFLKRVSPGPEWLEI